MPEITLEYSDETQIPSGLKAFKTADNKVKVWVNSSTEELAKEVSPGLEKNRNEIKAEKDVLEDKYKALLATTSSDDKATAAKMFELEQKAKNPLSEADQKILDAVRKANANITPEELEKSVKEYPTVSAKLQTIEKQTETETIFNASGFKDKTVFETVINTPALNPNLDSIIVKDEKDTSGKDVKVAYAKLKTPVDGKVELALPDYAKNNANWNGFMPSLTGTVGSPNFQPVTQNQGFQTGQPVVTGAAPGQPTNKYLGAMMQGQEVIQTPKPATPPADNK